MKIRQACRHRLFQIGAGSLLLLFFLLYLPTAAAEVKQNVIESEIQLDPFIDNMAALNASLQRKYQQQLVQLNTVSSEKNKINRQIEDVAATLVLLREQGKWLNYSTALGETLRRQLLSLPEKPKILPIDRDIANIRVALINYHEELRNLDKLPKLITPLSRSTKGIQYNRLIEQRKKLLLRLSVEGDKLVLELTKLKVAHEQLITTIDDVNRSAHRYFFWVADVNPMDKNYPIQLIRDISHIFLSSETLSQLVQLGLLLLTTPSVMILLAISLVILLIHFRFKRRFLSYLARQVQPVGKVTQDNFRLTVNVLFYSVLMALAWPILWSVVGYSLQISWDYSIAMALGKGVSVAAFILWGFMVSAYFAMPNGLFTGHLKWPVNGVKAAIRYYNVSIWIVIPLIVLLVTFDSYNSREFAHTIGRFCFILLCFALALIAYSLHRTGLPLYIDKKGSGDNILSRILWLILLSAPWFAIMAACFGYFFTAEILLARMEASVVIWFGLLVIYFLIRRWMLIQRRRIEFERAKQKRQERLAQRHKSSIEEEISNDMIEEPIIDLDVMSSQSLHLVRSILMTIALISMVVLWSELHSAFAFMDNIKLSSTMVSGPNGTEIEHSITLGSVFIAILIMTITIQLLKNLPALLELGILHHLDLSPGTGYAISTVSKYIVLMIGSAIACSFVGIDWGKIQWLIAALGVGLGFGLQEIFANFISGLIILFEKPIRIGDTVTIRDLTGSVAKINTRATTIIDWDRKEIIMPNKAFVTEQLINWSLSDSVTRIVLTVPATIEADAEQVISVIKQATRDCAYVLNDPDPQIFLVDIQEGLQLFEVRAFAAEIGHRMPLRSELQQLIIAGYRKHNLELPFPPLQTHWATLGKQANRRLYRSGGL